jgi:putative inorganic carbon (HCO3(-)) transporter
VQAVIALSACAVAVLAGIAVGNGLVLAAVAILPFGLIFSLRNPFLLCLAFILFSFFRLHEAFPVLVNLRLPLVLALGSIGTLSILVLFRRLEPAWTPELKLFLIFFLLVTIEVYTATDRGVAMTYWKDTYSKIAIMVFAIATLTRSPREFFLASRCFVISGFLIASVAIKNEWLHIGLVEGTRVTIGRDIGSAIGDPNDLSLVLLFPLSFAVSMILTPGTGKLAKAFGAVSAAEIALGILYTGSRGGLMGMMAVAGAFAAQRVKNKAIVYGFAVAGVAVLLALSGMRGGGSGAGVGGVDESAHGRIEAWKAGWRMACSHPFTGVGIDNFKYNYFYYTDYWEGFAKAVHSTWFCALAESGFIGFALFVTLIFKTVRLSSRSSSALSPAALGDRYDPSYYGMAQAVTSGIAGFCVSGTFLTQSFTWPLYILLALAVATSRAANRMQSETP